MKDQSFVAVVRTCWAKVMGLEEQQYHEQLSNREHSSFLDPSGEIQRNPLLESITALDRTQLSELEKLALDLLLAIYPLGSERPWIYGALRGIEYGRSPDYEKVEAARTYFVERLTFASVKELQDFTAQLYNEPFFSLPVWARNLSYRLLCLQRPNDPATLRAAANDLELWGPDWDEEARRLKSRADQLEG